MTYTLGKKELIDIATGGCFFGSGGGGTLESALNLISFFEKGDYYPTDCVRVVSVEEVIENGGDSVVVAYLGAPVMINQTQYPYGPELAVRQVMTKLEAQGRKLAYLVPPESGALGFLVVCLIAARLGLAVVDGDGAGRAVPSLPQLTFAGARVDPRPTFIVSQEELCVELNVSPRANMLANSVAHQEDVAQIIDNILRPIVSEPTFKQFGGLAIWIMDPQTLDAALVVRETMERAGKLGELLQGGYVLSAEKMVEVLREEFGIPARIVFGPGHFVSASQDTVNGFDVGKIKLEADGVTCTALYQNETLLAWTDNKTQPLCMAPDSLAYFVEGPGQSIYSNGDLLTADGKIREDLLNRKVSLIGIAAELVLTEPGSDVFASFMRLLANLGYYGSFVSVADTDRLLSGDLP